MEIGKTFCGRTDGRTDGRTHLSSNLLGHRRGDDLKMEMQLSRCIATVNKFILMNANRLYPHDLTFRRTDQSSESYAMTSAKRGLCVMIGNKNFSPQSGFMRRAGSDVDMATLYVVFKQLGFDVAMHHDVTAAETLRILAEGLRFVRNITHMLPV